MIYDIDPRSVAELVGSSLASRTKTWFNELAREIKTELNYGSRRDYESVLRDAAAAFAEQIGLLLEDEGGDLTLELEEIEKWYTRGYEDGMDRADEDARSYRDYPA